MINLGLKYSLPILVCGSDWTYEFGLFNSCSGQPMGKFPLLTDESQPTRYVLLFRGLDEEKGLYCTACDTYSSNHISYNIVRLNGLSLNSILNLCVHFQQLKHVKTVHHANLLVEYWKCFFMELRSLVSAYESLHMYVCLSRENKHGSVPAWELFSMCSSLCSSESPQGLLLVWRQPRDTDTRRFYELVFPHSLTLTLTERMYYSFSVKKVHLVVCLLAVCQLPLCGPVATSGVGYSFTVVIQRLCMIEHE